MATTFPQEIQTFLQKQDMTATDGDLVKQYQQAMEDGNIARASEYLAQIENYQNKIITADEMNTIVDTCVAVEQFFANRYNPAYIVSATQPIGQEDGDFWFKVTAVTT